MKFLAKIDAAEALLAQHGRVSIRAVGRELEVADEVLEEIVEELVSVRRCATVDDHVLVFVSHADDAAQPEGADPDGEIRHLTVMFCDLVDSTAHSTEVDDEDWRATIRRYHELAAHHIGEWGGHVGNYMGDGVVAYFGYPVAQEDAAERAVRAGLALCDAVAAVPASSTSFALSVRIGIHSGPVIVDEVGGVTQALGETTNIAARVEGQAAPNSVVISPATRRLVSGVFVLRDLGERTLKGVAEPMPLTRVERVGGVAPRLGAGRSGRTPLVGRDGELHLLRDRWHQVTEGWGQVVVVTGEAGIGKSRLVDSFREQLAGTSHSWLDASCSPYATSAALWPMAELQRRGLGFRSEDPPALKIEALERALEAVELDPTRGASLLAELHGFDAYEPSIATMSPELRRAERFDLLIDWVVALARLQPTAFVLDDMHWSDPTTLALVERLIDEVSTEPLLLILTTRPDDAPAIAARGHVTSIQLSRMTRDQVAQVAHGATGGDTLDPDAVAAIVARADGVPLFAEELAVAVAGSAADSTVPETLQDLLMARLERLGPLRDIAQTASVIGREFEFREVALLTPLPDAELEQILEIGVREELLYRRGTGAEAGYVFKHALMRDAVYQSMLRTSRARLHGEFAQAVVHHAPTVAQSRPDLVAAHFDDADESVRASVWWERAALRSLAAASWRETLTYAARAIETAAPDDGDRRLELMLLRIGAMNNAFGFTDPRLGPACQEAIDLAGQLGETDSLAIALCGRALSEIVGTNWEAASITLDEASARNASEAADIVHLISVLRALRALFGGDIHEAAREGGVAIEMASAASRRCEVAVGMMSAPPAWSYQAYALTLLGDLERAIHLCHEGRELSEASDHPTNLVNQLTATTGVWTFCHEHPTLLAWSREAVAMAEHLGMEFYIHLARANLGAVLTIVEHDPSGLDITTDAANVLAASGAPIGAPTILYNMAVAQLTIEAPSDALATSELAIATAEATDQTYADAQLHAVRAKALGLLSRTDEARAALQHGRSSAREAGYLTGQLETAIVAAELFPDERNSLTELTEALQAMTSVGDAPIAARARALLTSIDAR